MSGRTIPTIWAAWCGLLAMAAQAIAPALLTHHVLQERASACALDVCSGLSGDSERHEAPEPAHDESSCKLCRTMTTGWRGAPLDWAAVVLHTAVTADLLTHGADRPAAGTVLTPRSSRGPPALA